MRASVHTDPPIRAVTVQALPVQSTPVMANAIVATALPDVQAQPTSARTSNPISIGNARVAPTTSSSSHASVTVLATALPDDQSAEVGVAATFEVEDDFDDDPEAGLHSTSLMPVSGAPSSRPQSNLTRFLVTNQLCQFEGELRTLGAVDVPDLHELEEVRAAKTVSVATAFSFYTPLFCAGASFGRVDPAQLSCVVEQRTWVLIEA